MPRPYEVVIKSLSDRPGILLFLLLLLVTISYSNSLFSPLVLDDTESFMESSQMHPQDLFSLASMKQLASTRFGITRFIPLLTFAINNRLAVGNLPFYHLTNIFIHLLAVVTIFFFLRGLLTRTVLNERRSFLPDTLMIIAVCGLWGLSPVQTNAVTYLVQRMTSLAALFYLAALTFYLYGRTAKSRAGRNNYLFLCIISAGLALLSKENSATLPLALLLLEGTIITPGSASRFLARLKMHHWLIICLVLLIILPFPIKILTDIINSYGGRNFNCTERLLTEARVVIWYMSLLALPLPSRLNLDHDPLISKSLLAPPTTILSIILLALIIWTAYRYRHKSSLITFGIFFFFLNLAIESTVVPLELVFEHRLYLPSLGFFLALIGGLDLVLNSCHDRYGKLGDYRLLWMGLVILLCISSIFTSLRNNDWRDELSLYADALSKSPQKPRAYANYGMALGRQGRCQEAIPVLEEAIRLGSKFNEEHISTANNLLNCLKATATPEQAVARGEQLLKNTPDDANLLALPTFLLTMGENYYAAGNYRLALSAFQNALRNERPVNNGYLLVVTAALINEVYNKEGNGSALDMSRFKDKKTAIDFTLAEILLEIRDYQSAEKILAKVDPNSAAAPEQAPLVDLKKRLIDEQNRNRLVAEATDISRDDFLNSNRRFSMAMKLSRLITDHYPPLYFLAERMLTSLKAKNPTDPFVEWYTIRLQSAHKSRTVDLAGLEKTLAINPCFAPLRAIEIDQLLALDKRTEALAAMENLLKIYPGTPDWQSWIIKIQSVKKSLSKGGNNGQN